MADVQCWRQSHAGTAANRRPELVTVTTPSTAADGRTVGPELQPAVVAELLDVEAVAALLGGCSTRHVYRLADAGRMPRPVKLGALVRWRRAELADWLAAGCPPVRSLRGTAR